MAQRPRNGTRCPAWCSASRRSRCRSPSACRRAFPGRKGATGRSEGADAHTTATTGALPHGRPNSPGDASTLTTFVSQATDLARSPGLITAMVPPLPVTTMIIIVWSAAQGRLTRRSPELFEGTEHGVIASLPGVRLRLRVHELASATYRPAQRLPLPAICSASRSGSAKPRRFGASATVVMTPTNGRPESTAAHASALQPEIFIGTIASPWRVASAATDVL
jgi:hypothetical protein